MQYRAGTHDVTLEFRLLDEAGASAFGVAVEGAGVAIEQPIVLGDDYMAPVADRIAAMFRTGASPMTRDELLAPVGLMNEINRLLSRR
jgi:hypothetical protein